MSIYDIEVRTIDGEPTTLASYKGKTLLIVNVASACGYTPQYAGLQRLHDQLGPRGFAVLGFPCNQFGAQEPGSEAEIKSFCETSFGVTFPMFAKVDVNGPDRHPLYEILSAAPDFKGNTGDVRWNFEKFIVSPDGEPVGRFSFKLEPESEPVMNAINAVLPA